MTRQVPRLFGHHLGASVSALVDGQLDEQAEERAWGHVVQCRSCREQVEREIWLKRKLSTMCGNEPSARLMGSLTHMTDQVQSNPIWSAAEAWAAVDGLEEATRGRRRAGIAAAGVGSVSAVLLGVAAISTFGLGGGSPAAQVGGNISAPPTVVVPALARVHGRLPFEPSRTPDPDVADTVNAVAKR